jgi:hypothetical protein
MSPTESKSKKESSKVASKKVASKKAAAKPTFNNPDRLTPELEATPKVPAGTKEKPRMILVGTWVRLGTGKNIPEEVRGHDAQVTEAPMKRSDGDATVPSPHMYQEDDTVFTLRTRDEYSATIQATRAEFDVVSNQGRTGLGHSG